MKAEPTTHNWHLGSNISGDEYATNILAGEYNAIIATASVNVYFDADEAEANAAYIVKCVNGYERLLNDLKDTQSAIEHIINATPTGTTRNLLCDLNLNLLNSISQ